MSGTVANLLNTLSHGLKGLDFRSILDRKPQGDYVQMSMVNGMADMANRLTHKVVKNEVMDSYQTYTLITISLLLVTVMVTVGFLIHRVCRKKNKFADIESPLGHTAISTHRQQLTLVEGPQCAVNTGNSKKPSLVDPDVSGRDMIS